MMLENIIHTTMVKLTSTHRWQQQMNHQKTVTSNIT
jgi:hypothetical protein